MITGATGLVGSEIVKMCLERNIAVNYLTTSKEKIESKPNYQGFYWNPDNNEIDLNCFENVTAIINLAGFESRSAILPPATRNAAKAML